jgi:(E)-4-hydroxy-3-methylbut-2-enyl-diphosphate synthase
MSWHGDTPLGMVESAMEFIRMCEDLQYYNLVVSMKSSNAQVMVQAYRLLIETMAKEGMNYPLHLGVTEAGDGEDGRIKSAVGIGTLLEDGIGDTIRVSLTEEPEFEIPVAKALADRYNTRTKEALKNNVVNDLVLPEHFNPYEYNRRISHDLTLLGGHHVPVIIADLSHLTLTEPLQLSQIGYAYSELLDKYNISDQAADIAYLGDTIPSYTFPGNLKKLINFSTWVKNPDIENAIPLMSIVQYESNQLPSNQLRFVQAKANELGVEQLTKMNADLSLCLILEGTGYHQMSNVREVFYQLTSHTFNIPVIPRFNYHHLSLDELQLYAATDFGALLIDGFSDGIWLSTDSDLSLRVVNSISFGILQASRTRISKTEYISCPSCGRTLFDLQETTQLIRSRTDHLKGIKIGIMGCIVNGPGEMADADYGYVGTGPGKITLYRGKEVVRKNVNTENAVDQLIELIQEDGNWIEK